MKAIVFTVGLSLGLMTFASNAVAQQETQQSTAMTAKKGKARKAGTESNEVVTASPTAAKKKRTIQRANNTDAAPSGSVMSAGRAPRDSK